MNLTHVKHLTATAIFPSKRKLAAILEYLTAFRITGSDPNGDLIRLPIGGGPPNILVFRLAGIAANWSCMAHGEQMA